jgi:hypothetical protein
MQQPSAFTLALTVLLHFYQLRQGLPTILKFKLSTIIKSLALSLTGARGHFSRRTGRLFTLSP